jgi:hypothetical protein
VDLTTDYVLTSCPPQQLESEKERRTSTVTEDKSGDAAVTA